jgi:very-short-patch-repair endonuclease
MEGQRDSLAIDGRIAVLAEAQHGVVSRAQLLIAGLGAGGIEFRLRVGRLHRLHRGVYAVGHRRVSREGRWVAAVLACGDGAALSHTTAAALWDLRRTSAARVHVTVPTNAGLRQREGIAVHRARALLPGEVTRHEESGICVTSPARTLLDVAGMLRAGALERAVEQSLVLRLFDLAALDAVLDAHPTRAGAATLTAIVARIADEPSLTRSEAEALFLDLCHTYRIDRPVVNSRVEGLEVDFAWPTRRVVVEIDGHAYHGTRAAFERDRARDARLTVAGYRVLRFTYRRLVREPDSLAAILLELLESPTPPAARPAGPTGPPPRSPGSRRRAARRS